MILPLIGIFIALMIGEIVVRIYYYRNMSDKTLELTDDIKLYTYKASIEFVNRHGIKVKHNSLGLLGDEIYEKKEGTFRMLGLGDSVTAGNYLAEDQRFLTVLEDVMVKKGYDVEVVNAGVGGYNTWQELDLLKNIFDIIGPDMLIVGVCLNDFVYSRPALKKGFFGSVFVNYRDGSKARHFDFLYQRSDLYKFIYDSLAAIRKKKFGDEGYKRYRDSYRLNISDGELKRWKQPFLEIKRFAEDKNIPCLFVIFPIESQIQRDISASYAPLSRYFDEIGMHHMDLLPDFRERSGIPEKLYQSRDLIHPTALGHRIAGHAIAEYILENDML